ncbi:class I SAM-dependent methyltransferase [Vibrio sp.]|uniref:class I SAM-dependent methyltransferase n=1 Tax=Vibrio sp. TaxID=678 RepID=UPI003D0AD219
MTGPQSNSKLNQPDSSAWEVPEHLMQPLWLRGQESLVNDGLLYDPIAASACRRCHYSPDCDMAALKQQQLLTASLTSLCDQRIADFLHQHADGWVINVGARLDTRFYRLDNGRCHWLELDISSNLLWREKLFHPSERYQQICGSVDDFSWLEQVTIPDNAAVMIVCETALLECDIQQVRQFIQTLGRDFVHASACLVLAGDLANKPIGRKLGTSHYAHGVSDPVQTVLDCLPWARAVSCFAPFDRDCRRLAWWQRWATKFPALKYRLTPVLVQLNW